MATGHRTTLVPFLRCNLRKQFTKWRWLIAVFYGTMLIIMVSMKRSLLPNAQQGKPDLFMPMGAPGNVREQGNRILSEDDIVLERYNDYIRTHNITVTMFTTFADREETRYVIQNNTILNWLHLQNVNFKLVLFGSRREIADYHLQHVDSFKKRLHRREADSGEPNAKTQKKFDPLSANNVLMGFHQRVQKNIRPNLFGPQDTLNFVDPRIEEKIKITSFPTSNDLYTSKSYSKNDPYYQTWDFIPLEKHLTALGRPILKKMYLEVQKRYESDLYMYVNGDILFHAESLLETLYGIKRFVDDPQSKTEKWLIFGGRREVDFHNATTGLNHALQFGDDAEIQKFSINSRVRNYNALDFFICSKSSFPWVVVPDFVVSLPLFDHWLVLYSNKVGIETFDISRTALVVHQRGVQKLKDSKYEKADGFNKFLFDSAVGIRCVFDTNQARLQCMKQRTRRRRVGGEDAIIILQNSLFYKMDNVGCVYPYPLMAPVLGPIGEQDTWNFTLT
ncbi:unnamed protein product [Owenia fusiformis]|uniref:Uncharacterized protein n=1 Tax=Owenia fusiformis TaxID=6347 RepID=A0A8S4PWP1_OWEFU|nr:unnamed protein product [Owenia fusiformis]